MTELFDSIDQQWQQLCASTRAASVLRRWQLRQPAFDSLTTLTDLSHDSPAAIFHGLIGMARTDPTAQLALLRLLRPGLARLAHDFGSVWPADEAQSRTVSTAIEEITRPAPFGSRAAGFLVRSTRRNITRQATRERAERWFVDSDQAPSSDTATTPQNDPGRELVNLVRSAVAERALTPEQGGLILLHRLADVTTVDLQVALQCPPDTIRKRRLKAEFLLRHYARRAA